MRLLYIPQFSMSDGKVLFIDKDGAFVTLKIFLKYLKERLNRCPEEKFSITVLLPKSDSISQTVFYDEIEAILDSTTHLSVDYCSSELYTGSSIKDRYNFDMAWWTVMLGPKNVVINNIPELSRNIRAALGPRNARLVSFHHFPDYIQENKLVSNWQNGDKFSYFWRQLDACLCSDMNVFNCKSSLKGWLESIDWALGSNVNWIARSDKFTTLPYTDLTEYTPGTVKFDEITAVFPARITESLYTNWEKVFELFSQEETQGRVIICNPSGDKGLEVLGKKGYLDDKNVEYVVLDLEGRKVSFLKIGKILISYGLTREQYIDICRQSHAGICLYEHERYGGIAIREVIGYGQGVPVCLNRYECAKWYKDVLGQNEMVNLEQITPKTYNSMLSMQGKPAHAQILKNFNENEHYMKYYPNFERIMGALNA